MRQAADMEFTLDGDAGHVSLETGTGARSGPLEAAAGAPGLGMVHLALPPAGEHDIELEAGG